MVSTVYMGKHHNLQLVFGKRSPQCRSPACWVCLVGRWSTVGGLGKPDLNCSVALDATLRSCWTSSCIKDRRSLWPGFFSSMSWTVFGSLLAACLNRWWFPVQLLIVYVRFMFRSQVHINKVLSHKAHWWRAFGSTFVQDSSKMLEFAWLYHLVLSILQGDFKSNPFPRPYQRQFAIVSTQCLPLTQSKAYPQEPPIRCQHVLQAEDMRWTKGCLTITPFKVQTLQGSSCFHQKKQKRGGQRNIWAYFSRSCAWTRAFPKCQLCFRNRFGVLWNSISN